LKHRQTRIYQHALALCSNAQQHIETLPRGFAYLADQLKRASSSVLLNFSEGQAKRTFRERKRYFSCAKGSVYEVAALYDLMLGLNLISCKLCAACILECEQLAAMLEKYR
jgi:four helix bundle protein